MKVAGEALTTRNTRKVCLTRGEKKIELTIAALPPGWDKRLRTLGLFDNAPRPPMRPKERAKGIYVKNEQGKVEVEEDFRDPAYRAEMGKFNSRITAVIVAEHLSQDPAVEFETPAPAGNDPVEWRAYAEALSEEIESTQSGFTEEEINEILRIGRELGSSINLEEALNGFLPQA